jgi:hypothetical protein
MGAEGSSFQRQSMEKKGGPERDRLSHIVNYSTPLVGIDLTLTGGSENRCEADLAIGLLPMRSHALPANKHGFPWGRLLTCPFFHLPESIQDGPEVAGSQEILFGQEINEGGGRRRIRTFEGISQQIYSLPPLTAWVFYRPTAIRFSPGAAIKPKRLALVNPERLP